MGKGRNFGDIDLGFGNSNKDIPKCSVCNNDSIKKYYGNEYCEKHLKEEQTRRKSEKKKKESKPIVQVVNESLITKEQLDSILNRLQSLEAMVNNPGLVKEVESIIDNDDLIMLIDSWYSRRKTRIENHIKKGDASSEVITWKRLLKIKEKLS